MKYECVEIHHLLSEKLNITKICWLLLFLGRWIGFFICVYVETYTWMIFSCFVCIILCLQLVGFVISFIAYGMNSGILNTTCNVSIHHMIERKKYFTMLQLSALHTIRVIEAKICNENWMRKTEQTNIKSTQARSHFHSFDVFLVFFVFDRWYDDISMCEATNKKLYYRETGSKDGQTYIMQRNESLVKRIEIFTVIIIILCFFHFNFLLFHHFLDATLVLCSLEVKNRQYCVWNEVEVWFCLENTIID